jgi:prepilin-type N-terminal cleavage/methylation domain-containing protein
MKRAASGMTLVEVMMTLAILSIIVVALVPLIQTSTRALTEFEARSSLDAESQKAMNRMTQVLTESKRIFQNTAGDAGFLAAVQLSSGAPAAMTGSELPTIEATGSVSPSSTSSFVADSVGNSLFFASLDLPQDLTVDDASSSTQSVRIDAYHFNYYYLAQDDGAQIGGQDRISIWEWRSVSYADYGEIAAVSDSTERGNVVAALKTAGFDYAWDSSTGTASAAFYALGSDGSLTLDSSPTILQKSARSLIRIVTGITWGDYRYGVSPNTSAAFETNNPVPEFAAASGSFPSGLEILVVGPDSSRQILLRLVMAAEGSFRGVVTQEQIGYALARDLY